MSQPIPDFKARSLAHQSQMSVSEVDALLEAGRAWKLAPVLSSGGAIVFPHATLAVCGHQIVAAVHACLDSGADRVIVLGVLHALTEELKAARGRVASGGHPASEATWGLQGPGRAGRQDWEAEFSLSHFQFLWREETRRRGIAGPELKMIYPFLTGDRPDLLPGVDELKALANDAVVVATIDPVHHGIGYGDPVETALNPKNGGLELARQRIEEGLETLQRGDLSAYLRHCSVARSDGRDVAPLLWHLRGTLTGEILDLVTDDMSVPYHSPSPTWVAGALIALQRTGQIA